MAGIISSGTRKKPAGAGASNGSGRRPNAEGEGYRGESGNIGNTDAHGILVELKCAPASKAAAGIGDPLTAVTFINGIPGREEDLERHLLGLTGPTRAEAGNLEYDLYQSLVKQNQVVRIEMWRDRAALEAHKAMPYMKEYFAKRQREGWTTEITLWKRVGD